MTKMLLICLTMILTTSCVGGDPCTWSKKFKPDAGFEERWTPGEKRQAIAHNRKVVKFCT